MLGKRPENRRDLTRGALAERAGRVAGDLAAKGLAGETVAILCPNPEELLVAISACFLSGAIAVPMPPVASRRSSGRIAAIARAAKPKGFLVGEDASALPWVADILRDGSPTILQVAESEDRPAGGFTLPRPQDPALVQFTSGSTGDPTGVLLTHGNLSANCAAIAGAYGLDSSTIGLSWLPLHHDMGLVGHVLTPLFIGCRSCLMDALLFLQRPLLWVQRASEERATITSAPNFAYELCSRAAVGAELTEIDLSHLSTAICGGEPVLMPTLERFADTFAAVGFRRNALAPSYGLAEATLLVSSGKSAIGPTLKSAAAPFGDANSAVGPWTNLGKPVNGVTVRILDPESEAVRADGSFGEIEISGPCVGRPFGAARFDDYERVRTGDLGFISGGELVVTGRKKDLIILKGQNVFPADVEKAALGASPAVVPGGVAAIGVDSDGSEALVVIVEIQKGGVEGGDLAVLRRHINEAVAIATGHAPHAIVAVQFGSLPRTSSGKVQRGKVRGQYIAQELEPYKERRQDAAQLR